MEKRKEHGKEIQGVEKVCSFLSSRGVKNEVVEKFRSNMMDEDAVFNSSREDLEQLGLIEKGHVISLKGYVLNFVKDRELGVAENAIKKTTADRTIKKARLRQTKNKNVYLGWKHLNQGKFVQVRERNGGGTREVSCDLNSSLETIKNIATKLFFPNNKSKAHGVLENLEVHLGDFSHEKINDLYETLETYIARTKICGRVRLYILTKKVSIKDYVPSTIEDDDNDEDFQTPVFNRALFDPTTASTPSKDNSVEDDTESEELMMLRRGRVPTEPFLSEAHVTISVLHCNLGTKVRLFNESDKFSAVYDWVGSLATFPKHFELIGYKGTALSPDETVYDGVFNMKQVVEPIRMTPEGEVAFQGFATRAEPNTDHSFSSTDNVVAKSVTNSLDSLREDEVERFNNNMIQFEISRESIYEDMLSIFKKRCVANRLIRLSFAGEEAVGDGITLDAFSAFFCELYKKMEGESQLVPSSSLEEEELDVIGKIIHHSYIQCNMFPYGLCKSSLKYHLLGHVSDNDL